MPKINEWTDKLKDYEERAKALTAEEVILFGFKSNYNFFSSARDFFQPYSLFWSSASDFLFKKRMWFESTKLLDLNCEQVHDSFKHALDSITLF
jgi:hypothetical protein